MKPGQASSTAYGAAMLRAAHLVIDGEPKVVVDDFAIRFLRAAGRESMVDNPALQSGYTKLSRAHMVGRAAYTDERLREALARGCRQQVILGAGFDATPLRLADELRDCVTFEVDHPDTQAAKRAALADITWPDNVVFVEVDFETDSLEERLRASGWKPDTPTFWSWLGVTMYLTDDAIFETLGFVSTSAPGSTIVVGYNCHDDECTADEVALRQGVAANMVNNGEPWLSFFKGGEFAARVEALGYSDVYVASKHEIRRRWFTDRADGLVWSNMTGLLVAHV